MRKVEEKFGSCLDHLKLIDPISDLYQMGIDVVEKALSSALMDKDETLQPYPFYVGYPLQKDFNAGTCDCDEGGSIVAISAAVPALLINAFLAYSSRVDIVTGLPRAIDGKIISYETKLDLIGELPYLPQTPDDFNLLFEKIISEELYQEGNLAYSLILYEIALRHVAMHEVMHIVLGHTGYLKKQLSLNVFMEFSSAREKKMSRSLSHCLEFLSDQHAVRGITARMLDGDFSSEASALILEQTHLPAKDYLARCIVTALSIVFHLFPSSEGSLKTQLYSHPNPYLRMQWIAMEIGHEVGKQINYKESVLLTFASVYAALHSNFQTPSNWREIIEEDLESIEDGEHSFSDQSYQQMLDVSTEWRTKLWKTYSPLYRNDGSGRLEEG